MAKSKIALVGFSARSNQAVKDLPPDVEIWSINHAWRFGWKISRLFEMHPKEHLESPHFYTPELQEAHVAYLREAHNHPVYMLQRYDDYPASVEYPLTDALALGRRRFSSSFCYMAAMAVMECAAWVGIYGFDMDDGYQSEYRYQRPDALYWIGRMEGAGIEVYIDENSPLLRDSKLYGYESVQMIGRFTLENEKRRFEKQLAANLEKMNYWKGVFSQRQDNESAGNVRKFENQAAMCQGAIEAIQNLIDTCDLPEVT
jgi:hypothetical protein